MNTARPEPSEIGHDGALLNGSHLIPWLILAVVILLLITALSLYLVGKTRR